MTEPDGERAVDHVPERETGTEIAAGSSPPAVEGHAHGQGARGSFAKALPVRSDWRSAAVALVALWLACLVSPSAPWGWLSLWVASWGWLPLLVGTLGFARLTSWARTREKHVRATPDAIFVGEKRFARRDIQTAIPMRVRERVFLRISGKLGSRADIEVPDENAAEALLADLGLDAENAAMSFRLTPKASSKWMLAIPFFLYLFFTIGKNALVGSASWPLSIPLYLLAYLGWQRARQVQLIVGKDGVQVAGLTKSAFYRHTAIADVLTNGAALTLALRNGAGLVFVTNAERRKATPSELDLVQRIRARIVAARLAAENAPSETAGTTSLDRGDRTAREWLEHLRRVGEGADASFRRAAVSRDALLRMVESPASRAKDRVAALVSLAKNLAPEEAPRVRVAIDACAEQKLASRLRVVLEDPSPESLERALMEAEAEDHASEAPKRAVVG